MPEYIDHHPTAGSRHRFKVPALEVNGSVVADMTVYAVAISLIKQDGTVIDFVSATSVTTALVYYDYTLPTTAANLEGKWKRKWKFTAGGFDYFSEWIEFYVLP